MVNPLIIINHDGYFVKESDIYPLRLTKLPNPIRLSIVK